LVDAFTEEDWDKCFAFNVKQSLWLAQASKPIFNANENGGHLIITSSVAGTRASGSSMVNTLFKVYLLMVGIFGN